MSITLVMRWRLIFPGYYVEQQYLPDSVKDKRFYEPSDQGYEQYIAMRLAAWRGGTVEQ